MAENIINKLWVEKYRPQEMEDVVVDPSVRATFQHFIDTQNVPHCLLIGLPGTGKTTIARILKSKLIKADTDYLFLNASNERGINDMRDTVLAFMRTPPLRSPLKLCIMDESDNLTPDAWMILRNPIENEAYNPRQATRFVFTANLEYKIPDFMMSRCSVFRFAQLPRDYVISKAKDILETEEVEYSIEELVSLVDSTYPDMRSTIQKLQASSQNGKLSFTNQINAEEEMYQYVCRILDLFNKQQYNEGSALVQEVRNVAREAGINPYNTVKKVMDTIQLSAIQYVLLNCYLQSFNRVLDKTHHFVSMLYDIMLAQQRFERR